MLVSWISGLPVSVFGNGQALPLHPGIEHPQDEVKEAMIADIALRTPLGHREVREDKFVELVFRNCTGMDVISGCLAVVLIMCGPHLNAC